MAESDLSFSEWMAGALEAALAEGEIGQRSVVLRWDGQKVEGLEGFWESGSFEKECNLAMRSAAPLLSLCRVVPTKEHSDFWQKQTDVPRVSENFQAFYDNFQTVNFYLARNITANSSIHIHPQGRYSGNERPDPWLIESMARQAISGMLLPSLAEQLNGEALLWLSRLIEIKTYESLSEIVAEAVSKNMSACQIALLHSHNKTRGLEISEWKKAKETVKISGKKLKISAWGKEPSYLNEIQEAEIFCGDFSQIFCLLDDISVSAEVAPTQVNLEAKTNLICGPWKHESIKLLAGKIGTA